MHLALEVNVKGARVRFLGLALLIDFDGIDRDVVLIAPLDGLLGAHD